VDRTTVEALEQRSIALDTLAEEVARARVLAKSWRSLLEASHDVRRIAEGLRGSDLGR